MADSFVRESPVQDPPAVALVTFPLGARAKSRFDLAGSRRVARILHHVTVPCVAAGSSGLGGSLSWID